MTNPVLNFGLGLVTYFSQEVCSVWGSNQVTLYVSCFKDVNFGQFFELSGLIGMWGDYQSRHFQSNLLFSFIRFITAAAEVGACPLHSHEKYKALYEKLVESSHEESDMEPSDADSDDGEMVKQVSAKDTRFPGIQSLSD